MDLQFMAPIQNHFVENRAQILADFYNSPSESLHSANTIAVVRGCSIATLDRDRWNGGGIPYKKVGRAVRYKKSEVLAWLDQHETQRSTSENTQ